MRNHQGGAAVSWSISKTLPLCCALNKEYRTQRYPGQETGIHGEASWAFLPGLMQTDHLPEAAILMNII